MISRDEEGKREKKFHYSYRARNERLAVNELDLIDIQTRQSSVAGHRATAYRWKKSLLRKNNLFIMSYDIPLKMPGKSGIGIFIRHFARLQLVVERTR